LEIVKEEERNDLNKERWKAKLERIP